MRTVLHDFDSELLKLRQLAAWLSTSGALQPAFLPQASSIRCGIVMLMSGYFETFLRDVFRAFIGELNGLKKPVGKLPPALLFVHFENGAKQLQWIAHKERVAKNAGLPKSVDLAERLSSVGGGGTYELAWEAFSQTKANPGPRVIDDLLKDVGVSPRWPQIQALAGTGVLDLELFLTSFIAIRNECAHTGSMSVVPTPPDLEGFCDNFSLLATAIVLLLEARVASLSLL